jgi:membrane protein DedA with SNARE-associated domain
MVDFLDLPQDLIGFFLHNQGLIAPSLLLTLEESGVPLPVPGDVLVAYRGYQISQKLLSYQVAFISVLLPVLLGSSILYFLSYNFGEKLVLRIGKYLHFDEKKLVRVERYFKKYGILVIIIGRHIPGFRIPITIFSGISKISYPTFILSTFVSVVFWIAFYLSVGEKLGRKTIKLLHSSGHYFYLLIFPILILIFLLYLRRRRKHKVLLKQK